ncbi:MAG: MFS transporter [Proteobacteria bacterium]|nr:MAG: MFS transporter [Pseudomonadota bacterium]
MKLFPGYNLNSEEQRIIWLSSLGGMLEFYDFTIYGLFAVYFSQQFFPTHDAFISLIASYSIFVVGYIVRPLGGILFSHIGDELGRKKVLILTMMLMGISSLGMGLLPNYAQIGIYAPALMLLFRLIQGLAIGGELPSMIVYASECMPNKRGYAMGGVFGGTLAGLIPGMLINMLILHLLSQDEILAFGWRIPFILGGLLCIVAYFVRRELHETAAFNKLKQHSAAPFIDVMQNHLFKVLVGAGLVAIMATPIILLIIFMPTYLVKLVHVDAKLASDAILLAACVGVTSTYITGILAQKYRPLLLMKIYLIAIFIAALICYYTISLKNVSLVFGMCLFAIAQGGLVTLPAIVISYLFPTNVRLTGVALSYNISFVLFGGLTPIVITSIVAKTGWLYLTPLAILLITVCYTWWALNKAAHRVGHNHE